MRNEFTLAVGLLRKKKFQKHFFFFLNDRELTQRDSSKWHERCFNNKVKCSEDVMLFRWNVVGAWIPSAPLAFLSRQIINNSKRLSIEIHLLFVLGTDYMQISRGQITQYLTWLHMTWHKKKIFQVKIPES